MLSLLATSHQVTLRNRKYQLTIRSSDKKTKVTPIHVKNQVKNSNLLSRLGK